MAKTVKYSLILAGVDPERSILHSWGSLLIAKINFFYSLAIPWSVSTISLRLKVYLSIAIAVSNTKLPFLIKVLFINT